MFRNAAFDKLLDKATSHLLMEPDWGSNLQICDLVRQADIQPKTALAAIKKKLIAPSPHTVMYALELLESLVKNCGAAIHEELTTKAYCDLLHELAKTTTHENVRQKVLELIQTWSNAFRKNPKCSAIKDTLNVMKSEGYKFPTLKESDAMYSADTAPEWADSDKCHRCRIQFTFIVRKHHCRACGQVFCASCSEKTGIIPKFGIEKEVRVCDVCFVELNKPSVPAGGKGAEKDTDLPEQYLKSSLAQQNQNPVRKNEEELKEEEELNLAIALSQSEAEHKEKEKKRQTDDFFTVKKRTQSPNRAISPQLNQPTADSNSEVDRYLDRAYWENKATSNATNNSIDHYTLRDNNSTGGGATSPSAPVPTPSPASSAGGGGGTNNMKSLMSGKGGRENGGMMMVMVGPGDKEMEEFVETLKSQVEVFINRMKSNSSRGRYIANDSSVQTLFMNITAMHSRLLRYIQQHDDSRLHYEHLQDKLTQVKDARAALDDLRDEHREQLRRRAAEAERVRQLQMANKLDIMRKKKQEYLQYQRQLALQRIQEQEREMAMRQEHQKHQYMMGTVAPPPGYPPYMGGSPVHMVGQQPPQGGPGGYPNFQYGAPMMPPVPMMQQQQQQQMQPPSQQMQQPTHQMSMVAPPGYVVSMQPPPQHVGGGQLPQQQQQQPMHSMQQQQQQIPPNPNNGQQQPQQMSQQPQQMNQQPPPPGVGPPPQLHQQQLPQNPNNNIIYQQQQPQQQQQSQQQQQQQLPQDNGGTQTGELITFD